MVLTNLETSFLFFEPSLVKPNILKSVLKAPLSINGKSMQKQVHVGLFHELCDSYHIDALIFLGVFSCLLSVPFPMENNVFFPIIIIFFYFLSYIGAFIFKSL